LLHTGPGKYLTIPDCDALWWVLPFDDEWQDGCVRHTKSMEVDMGLSRKREKELKKLRGNAESLWQAQHEVLTHAKSVLREAKKQATHLAHEEVVPRVRGAVDHHVRPKMDRSAKATRSAASCCRKKFVNDVLPSVAAVIGSTLSVVDLARSGQLREGVGSKKRAFVHARDRVSERMKTASQPPKSKGSHAGGPIALILGVVAAAGVGYALWQTFRADDELWVTDDDLTTRSDIS
jgi:hypothetical protein